MIEGDALIVHLNPLQEAVQTGGDRDWRGVLQAIEALAARLPVPVVIKEVGAGISAAVAAWSMPGWPPSMAGAGGTSWAAVEAARAADASQQAIAEAFADGAYPRRRHCWRCARPARTPLIASGGIRDGVEAAKAICLGADLVGQAAGVLQAAMHSSEAVVSHFEVLIEQLRIACFCTGSADLAGLRQARLLQLSAC